jgi:hypothetical protein
MVARKRKVIIIVALVLLGAGLAVFLVTRGSGPPISVMGNFSARDISQIKREVSREIWREGFPSFSMRAIKELPDTVKRDHETRIISIGWRIPPSGSQKGQAYAIFSGTGGQFGCCLTNGTTGWRWDGDFIQHDWY